MSGIIPRVALRAPTSRALARQNLSRRFVSTTPPAHRSRSFKSSLARWTLAIGGVWYLSSSDVLAEGKLYPKQLPETTQEDESMPTIDSLAAARRERQAATSQAVAPPPAADVPAPGQTDVAGGPQDLEEEADSQGAFNPETGEINWDCPCLGGMAHGPCGPEFREAFSCFVYSSGEPKGIECIDRFKSMQDCFRAHPDVYGAELTDDPTDEEIEENARAAEKQAQAQGQPVEAAAAAPYSGAEGPQDKVPGANLTSTPSASPGSVSSSTGIPSSARSADEGSARKG